MLANPEQLPGWVEGLTERTALGRLGEADDIAETIVAVLEMSWVTGQTVFADGKTAIDRARTVLVDRSRLGGDFRLRVVLVLIRFELGLFKKGNYLVKD